MKIHILKLQLNENDEFELVEINSLKEAQKLDINHHYYFFFKALQFNKDFIKDINKLRKKHKINAREKNYKIVLLKQANEVFYSKSKSPTQIIL
jgi:hypothetical protein